MAVKVWIPTPFRGAADGRSEIEVEGGTVEEVLVNLERDYPDLGRRVREGSARQYVNIFVNGQDIRFLDGTGTPVRDGDEVSLIPAMAGGV